MKPIWDPANATNMTTTLANSIGCITADQTEYSSAKTVTTPKNGGGIEQETRTAEKNNTLSAAELTMFDRTLKSHNPGL